MSFGLRELIWILIAILSVYVAYQVIRMLALRGRGSELGEQPPPAERGAAEAMAVSRVDETPQPAAPAFMQELELQQLRRDLAQLRGEVDGLRAALEALRNDGSRQREELEALQAERNVSPQYAEAMVFVRRGLDSEAVAERCGISVAEAELVRSLLERGERRAQEP